MVGLGIFTTAVQAVGQWRADWNRRMVQRWGFPYPDILLASLLLAHAAILGALVMWVTEGLPPGEGVYFALVTALGIGFGDSTPKTLMGQLLVTCFILYSIGTTTTVVSVAQSYVLKALQPISGTKQRNV